MKELAAFAFCIAMLSACGGNPNSDRAAVPVDVEQARKLVSGIDLSRMDLSVRPQDDLFRHINGKWISEFEIPADKPRYSTMTRLRDKARRDVRDIIEKASTGDAPQGSDAQKVGDLYKSFMNEALLEEMGNAPLAAEFAKIDEISNASGLSDYIAYAQIVSDAPFWVYVDSDDKKPDTYVTYMGQSGLGLPNRSYYFEDDGKSKEIRSLYLAHVAKMAELAGLNNGQGIAAAVMSIETQLAEKQLTKEQMRDPVALYNKKSLADLSILLPALDWERWKETAMLQTMNDVIVDQPSYFQAVNSMLSEVPLEDWRRYFQWRLINSAAPYMNASLDQEHFSFFEGVLLGVKEQEPRWVRGVRTINRVLGEVVGKIYVTRHFTAEAKGEMSLLVENLRTAYGDSIKNLEWMDEETKKDALDKLSKFTVKIGYPEKWKDYSALEISPNDLFGNMKMAAMAESKRNRGKLGQPIDRAEWSLNPQTVNAKYSPYLNEIIFPAAILQPPYFNLEADVAVNYGGIGAVIGHEMGHGFDDEGSQYDGDGRLSNWWTEEDRAEYNKRANKLIAQYNDFRVLDDVAVNGEYTLGENIADLSGLTIAFKAYQSIKVDGEAPLIDGLTGDQRVFAGWAQIWASKERDEYLRKRIETAPHSPSEFRANGAVMNMPEFYSAFDVTPNDKMYIGPSKRVKIW